MTAGVMAPSLEDVADFAIQILRSACILEHDGPGADWGAFIEVQRKIEAFEVPWTTITSVMRRFFYAISAATLPERIVGAGTFVGFGLAWFAMGRPKGTTARRLVEAVGLDVEAEATIVARRNAAALDLGARLRFEQTDAVAWLSTYHPPISLLYIDIDTEGSRKRGYAEVLQAARPHLAPGGLIVAHDACVPLFSDDFSSFHALIKGDIGLRGPIILPLDECGVSVSRVI